MSFLQPVQFVPKDLLIVLLFNTVIALLLTAVGFGAGFLANLVYSQAIGISMCILINTVLHFSKERHSAFRLMTLAIAMVAGAALGMTAGSWLTGSHAKLRSPGSLGSHLFTVFFISILFAIVISYFFLSRRKIRDAEIRLQEERLARLTREKQMAEAQLRLLQAQIEPHFLFNTLANAVSMIDTAPDRARAMLLDLNRYLRTSLARTRQETTTLGQEKEMIRAYLDIYRMRLGDRLRYSLEIPDRLAGISLPPLLLQPLVENAVIHGIEPRVDGGALEVRAEAEHGLLRLKVTDTGSGMPDEPGAGIGLANVRSRLATLYGGKGRLLLEGNRPHGLHATIEIPCEEAADDSR